jgi:iron(III) transport system permease protein
MRSGPLFGPGSPFGWGHASQWGAIIFLVVVTAPILVLLSTLWDPIRLGQLDWFQLALPQGRRLHLLTQSLGLAAGVAVGGLSIGLITSLYLVRWQTNVFSYLRWFFLVLAPVPPFIHAMAWSALFVEINDVLRLLGLAEISFRGALASCWVQVMAFAPIAVTLTWLGLETVDPDLIEAARFLSPDSRTLGRIVLPLAAPVVLAGGCLLFLLSLLDYSVPSLFQMNVYALDIFAEFSANNSAGRAMLLSLPLLLVTSVVVLLFQAQLRKAVLRPPWRRRPLAAFLHLPAILLRLGRLGLLLLGLQFLVPLFSLLVLTNSWTNLAMAVTDGNREIVFSLELALLTAVAGLPLAYAAARRALSGRGLSWGWWLALTVPLAIPAPLIGIGLIVIWNRPALGGVYGSAAMPVLAALARFVPIAGILLLTQLRRIDPALIEAARVLETSPLRTWLWIELPILAPGLLAAAAVLFVLTLGELGATLLLAPPGRATLTMRLYNFLHYGASDTVAGLSLVLMMTVLVFGFLVLLSLAAWFRLIRGGGQEI